MKSNKTRNKKENKNKQTNEHKFNCRLAANWKGKKEILKMTA